MLLENLIFRKLAPRAFRYLPPPDLQPSIPLSRRVATQAGQEFQLAPPLTLHLVDPELFAGMWSATRETYVVGHADRRIREVVAGAVSELNECPYCVDVHTGMAESGKPAKDDRQLLAREWALATLSPALLSSRAAPNTDQAQLFGTAVMYHYVNRMVNVFLDDSPVPMPMPRGLSQRMLGFFSKRLLDVKAAPGVFMWEDEPEPCAEFKWALPNEAVSRAFAQMNLAAERAGSASLSLPVRRLVLSNLAGWRGENAPLSRHWADELIETLDPVERAAGRFALLAARASWQIDDAVALPFLDSTNPKALVQAAAWASFAAAKRIGSWLGATGRRPL